MRLGKVRLATSLLNLWEKSLCLKIINQKSKRKESDVIGKFKQNFDKMIFFFNVVLFNV